MPVPFRDAESVVKYAARRMYGKIGGMVALDELESEAWVGLVRLIGVYDPALASFSTFFGQRIYFHLIDWLRQQSWVPRAEFARVRAGEVKLPRFLSLQAVKRQGRRGA